MKDCGDDTTVCGVAAGIHKDVCLHGDEEGSWECENTWWRGWLMCCDIIDCGDYCAWYCVDSYLCYCKCTDGVHCSDFHHTDNCFGLAHGSCHSKCICYIDKHIVEIGCGLWHLNAARHYRWGMCILCPGYSTSSIGFSYHVPPYVMLLSCLKFYFKWAY